MPHLTFTGVHKEIVISISTELVDRLEALLECPRDYFTIELLETPYIADGKVVSPPCKVGVEWFDRGQDIQDKAAEIITSTLSYAGYKTCDIYFTCLEKNQYYENGQHF